MTIEPAEKYIARNGFRSAVGRKMKLSSEQVQMFEKYLKAYANGPYGVVEANCGDPAEEALELMGYPMSINPFPADLRQHIDQLGLARPHGVTLYPADPIRRDSGFLARAPWTDLFM